MNDYLSELEDQTDSDMLCSTLMKFGSYLQKQRNVYLKAELDVPITLPVVFSELYVAGSLTIKEELIKCAVLITSYNVDIVILRNFAEFVDNCQLFHICAKTNLLLIKLTLQLVTQLSSVTDYLADEYHAFFQRISERNNDDVEDLLFKWLLAVSEGGELTFFEEVPKYCQNSKQIDNLMEFAAEYLLIYNIQLPEVYEQVFNENYFDSLTSGKLAKVCALRGIELTIDEYEVFERIKIPFEGIEVYENSLNLLYQMSSYENSYDEQINSLFYVMKDLGIEIMEFLVEKFEFALNFETARDIIVYSSEYTMSQQDLVRCILKYCRNNEKIFEFLQVEFATEPDILAIFE